MAINIRVSPDHGQYDPATTPQPAPQAPAQTQHNSSSTASVTDDPANNANPETVRLPDSRRFREARQARQNLPVRAKTNARGIGTLGNTSNYNIGPTRTLIQSNNGPRHKVTKPARPTRGTARPVNFDVVTIDDIKAELPPSLIRLVDMAAKFLTDYADDALERGKKMVTSRFTDAAANPVITASLTDNDIAANSRAEAASTADIQPEQNEGMRQLAIIGPLMLSDDLHAYRTLLQKGFLKGSNNGYAALDAKLDALAKLAQDNAATSCGKKRAIGGDVARLTHTLGLACQGDVLLAREVLDYLGTIRLSNEVATAYHSLSDPAVRYAATDSATRRVGKPGAPTKKMPWSKTQRTSDVPMDVLTRSGKRQPTPANANAAAASSSQTAPTPADIHQKKIEQKAWQLINALHETPDGIEALAIVSRPHDDRFDFFTPVLRSFMHCAHDIYQDVRPENQDCHPLTALQHPERLSNSLYLGLLALAKRMTYTGKISGFSKEEAADFPEGAPDAALLTPLERYYATLARCGADADGSLYQRMATNIENWVRSATTGRGLIRLSPFSSLRDEALAFTRSGNMPAFRAANKLAKSLQETVAENNDRLLANLASTDYPVGEFEHLSARLRRDLVRHQLLTIWSDEGFLRSLKGHQLLGFQKEDIVDSVNTHIAKLLPDSDKDHAAESSNAAKSRPPFSARLKNALSPELIAKTVSEMGELYLTPSLAQDWLHDALYSHVEPTSTVDTEQPTGEQANLFDAALEEQYLQMQAECDVMFGASDYPSIKTSGSEANRRAAFAKALHDQAAGMGIANFNEGSDFYGGGISTKNIIHSFFSMGSLGGQVRFTPQLTRQKTAAVRFGLAGNSAYITFTGASSHQEQGSFGGMLGPRFRLPAKITVTAGVGAEYNLFSDTIHAEGLTLRLDRMSMPERAARAEIKERGAGDPEKSEMLGQIIEMLMLDCTEEDKKNGLKTSLMKVLATFVDRLHINLFGQGDDYKKVAIHTVSGRFGASFGIGNFRTGPTVRVLRGYRHEQEERKEEGASYSLHTQAKSRFRQTSLGAGWGAIALYRVSDHQAQGIGSIDAATGTWDLDIWGHTQKKTFVKVYEQYSKNTTVLNTYATYKQYYEKMMANLDALAEQYLAEEIKRQNKNRLVTRPMSEADTAELRTEIRERLLDSLSETLHVDFRKTQSFSEFSELSARRVQELNVAHTTGILAKKFGHGLLHKAAQTRKEEIFEAEDTWVFQFGMVTDLMSRVIEHGFDIFARAQRGHRDFSNTLISFIATT